MEGQRANMEGQWASSGSRFVCGGGIASAGKGFTAAEIILVLFCIPQPCIEESGP
jgi:hypothetical protein